MTQPAPTPSTLLQRPKRADALRNYEALLAAAREVFAEAGAQASLEEIARRAGVGIGTLYRNFPTRQALLEATYVDEVERISAYARSPELTAMGPWEALETWLRAFAHYATTKRVIGEALVAHLGEGGSEVFGMCRRMLFDAGEPLVARAQAAGAVRPDTDFLDVVRLVGGVATIKGADRDQVERIFAMALDGIRPRG